jgi:hypothetical protein
VVTAPPYAFRENTSEAAQAVQSAERTACDGNAGRASTLQGSLLTDVSPAPFAQQRFMARYPQHIHSVPTGPILGMRERPHGLAAKPFTGRNNPGRWCSHFSSSTKTA